MKIKIGIKIKITIRMKTAALTPVPMAFSLPASCRDCRLN